MEKILANEGVGNPISFHAEEHVDKRNRRLWEKCKEMVDADDGGDDTDQPPRQDMCEIMKPTASSHATSPFTCGPLISLGILSDSHVMRHAFTPPYQV